LGPIRVRLVEVKAASTPSPPEVHTPARLREALAQSERNPLPSERAAPRLRPMSKEYRVQGAPSGRGFDAPLIARRVRRTRHELGARGTSAIRVQSACPRRRASACSRDDRSPRPHAQGRRPIRGRRGCAGAVLRWDLSHPHTREPCSPKASEPPVRSARPDGECIDGCRCRDPRSRLPPFRAPGSVRRPEGQGVEGQVAQASCLCRPIGRRGASRVTALAASRPRRKTILAPTHPAGQMGGTPGCQSHRRCARGRAEFESHCRRTA
jgi:hypothetical protein